MATRAHRLKFIDRLFVIMHVNYGHLWSSLFVNEDVLRVAKAQWALQLHPWSERAIEAGLDRCKRVYEKPPTLPQFINLLRTDRAHDEYPKALPSPPCDKGKAMSELEQMREAIKRAP